MKNTNANNGFMTRKELSQAYKITTKTMVKRLLSLGIQLPKGRISPLDQERIYQAFGPPAGHIGEVQGDG